MDFARRWQALRRQVVFADLGWTLSLFLIGFSARLFLIAGAGNAAPFYDPWDAEAADIYVPYFQHTLTVANLFKAHNEHRIVFTRLYGLILVLLNGQWDNRLQVVLNAIFHSGIISGFGWLLARRLGRANWPFIWLPLLLALVLPFGWENTLVGFQSVFYFLLFFSLLTIWLLSTGEPRSARWQWGIVTGILALFSMASGFMAATAVAGIALLDVGRDKRNWRRYVPTLWACAGLTLGGWLLKADVPRHQALVAHSLFALQTSLGKALAWPSCYEAWLAPLNLLPLIALAWLYTRSREPDLKTERLVLTLGLWGMFQSFAAAYARGGNGNVPAWRYMDLIDFIMIANCLAIVLLVTRYRPQLRWPPLWHTIFILWAVACVSGLRTLTRYAQDVTIPAWAAHQAKRWENAREFAATDDPKVFARADNQHLPYPFRPELLALMRRPEIQHLLPAGIREPLPMLQNATRDTAFVPNGLSPTFTNVTADKCWGSFSTEHAAARGKFESLPMAASSLPYLDILVAGDLSEPGLTLELVDVKSGEIIKVKPSMPPGGAWADVCVKAPPGEFKLVALDESPTKWFAFKPPAEMGRLSYWAAQTLTARKYFLIVGLLCLCASLTTHFRVRQKTDERGL